MMSPTRFAQLHSSLNAVAAKVYEAVPKQEAWGAKKIASELVRQQANLDFRIVIGCLDTLRRTGLVKEPAKGAFQREPVREPKPEAPPKEPTNREITAVQAPAITTPQPRPKPAPAAPLDRLGALAQRVTRLGNDLHALAAELADAAVEVQEQIETSDADLTKLKQLQALLKSLG